MRWHPIHELVSKHVVRIETQDGTGTGFLFGYNKDRSIAAVATAAHVVGQAHRWRQPLRLIYHATQQEVFLPYKDRIVFIDYGRDSASILVRASVLFFEVEPLQLMSPSHYMKVGVEIAWIGFPSVAYPELCFFRGCVSAFVEHGNYYLVDGVAINGVSGGPVFAADEDTLPEVIGTVSAYLPNRAGGTPGLLRAQDISAFHDDLQTIHSFDEAKEKEKEAQQKAVAEGQAVPEPENRQPANPADQAAS
jgi:Trypsin-like peptidase domain